MPERATGVQFGVEWKVKANHGINWLLFLTIGDWDRIGCEPLPLSKAIQLNENLAVKFVLDSIYIHTLLYNAGLIRTAP